MGQVLPTRAIRHFRRSSSEQPWWRYIHQERGYPIRDLVEDAAIGNPRQLLTLVMSHTNTALLLATKWYVVIKNIVLIDPDLNELDEFHRSGVLSLSYGPSLKSGRHAVTLSLVS